MISVLTFLIIISFDIDLFVFLFLLFSNHSFRCSFRFLNRADSFGLSNPFDFLSNVDLIQPFVQWSWMLCFPCSFCSKTTSSHSSPGISMWNFTVSPSDWYRRIKSFRHHLCHSISSSFLCSFISNEWRCSSIYSSSSDVTVRHFLFSILFLICCVIHIVCILCHINNKIRKCYLWRETPQKGSERMKIHDDGDETLCAMTVNWTKRSLWLYSSEYLIGDGICHNQLQFIMMSDVAWNLWFQMKRESNIVWVESRQNERDSCTWDTLK